MFASFTWEVRNRKYLFIIIFISHKAHYLEHSVCSFLCGILWVCSEHCTFGGYKLQMALSQKYRAFMQKYHVSFASAYCLQKAAWLRFTILHTRSADISWCHRNHSLNENHSLRSLLLLLLLSCSDIVIETRCKQNPTANFAVSLSLIHLRPYFSSVDFESSEIYIAVDAFCLISFARNSALLFGVQFL